MCAYPDAVVGARRYQKCRRRLPHSIRAGIQLSVPTIEILLYLCSGGRSWDSQLAATSSTEAVGKGSASSSQGADPAAGVGSKEAGAQGETANGAEQGSPTSSGKGAEGEGTSSKNQPYGTGAQPEAATGGASAGRGGRGAHHVDASLTLSTEVICAITPPPVLRIFKMNWHAYLHKVGAAPL